LGRGYGRLGIGDWPQSPIPNPQSPIPNPQSPIIISKLDIYSNFVLKNIKFNFFNI